MFEEGTGDSVKCSGIYKFRDVRTAISDGVVTPHRSPPNPPKLHTRLPPRRGVSFQIFELGNTPPPHSTPTRKYSPPDSPPVGGSVFRFWEIVRIRLPTPSKFSPAALIFTLEITVNEHLYPKIFACGARFPLQNHI